MPIESPWNRDGYCMFCDRDAHHSAACPWIAKLVNLANEAQDARDSFTAFVEGTQQAAKRVKEELLKANKNAEEFKEAAADFAAKLQMAVNCMDDRGMLEEHVFTFPDGDTWEARR